MQQQVSPWGFIGMGAMACVLFLVLATLTVAPWWVSGLLLVLWLVLFVVGTRWFMPHPRRVPWLAVIAFLAWLPTVTLGTRVLGWR